MFLENTINSQGEGGGGRGYHDPLPTPFHIWVQNILLNAYNIVSGSETVGYFFSLVRLHKLQPGRGSPFLNVHVVRKGVAV